MITSKKLKSLFKLSCSVKIYVPSTINTNQTLDKSTTQAKVDETLEFLGRLFGGSTSLKAYGSWVTATGELVKERVIIVMSYCDQSSLEEHIEDVISYAERLKADMSQEAVSIEINNELYFV